MKPAVTPGKAGHFRDRQGEKKWSSLERDAREIGRAEDEHGRPEVHGWAVHAHRAATQRVHNHDAITELRDGIET